MENSKNKSHTNNKAQLDAIEKQMQVVKEEKNTFLKWASDYIDATFEKKLEDLYEQKRVFTTTTATTSNNNIEEVEAEVEAEIEQAAAAVSTSLSFLSNLRLKCKFCNRKMSSKVSFLLNVKLHVKL